MSVNLITSASKASICTLPKITPLLEKKEALTQEVEHLKRVKQEIEEKQKEILADLQGQQKEWDAKNSVLQAKNIQQQTDNSALKKRELLLSTGLQAHKCLGGALNWLCNEARGQYRLGNHNALVESFLRYLPTCQGFNVCQLMQ
ncbi:MAG: hypothetical protein Q8L98_08660 [Chlamydiales bacterium]|nr:hypothetical protein [Chlamydiales bacterium]